MNIPYVEANDTIILAKIGWSKFCTACTTHKMAHTSMLQMSTTLDGNTHYVVKSAKKYIVILYFQGDLNISILSKPAAATDTHPCGLLPIPNMKQATSAPRYPYYG